MLINSAKLATFTIQRTILLAMTFAVGSCVELPVNAQTLPLTKVTPAQVAAAAQFANTVSRGNDATFTHAFLQSMRLGSQAPLNQSPVFTTNRGRFEAQTDWFAEESLTASPEITISNKEESSMTYFEAGEAPSLRRMIADPRTTWRTAIWEGYPATLEEFPDCVAIGGNVGDLCCSGVLVSSNLVITAGHCDIGCLNWVYFGQSIHNPTQKIRVRAVDRYRPYDALTHSNDLTIIILEDMATNSPIFPIASAGLISQASSFTIVGFGKTNNDNASAGTKCFVDVPIIPNTCTTPDQTLKFGCNDGIEIVVGGPTLGDSCFGDSGGPAFVRQGEQWYISGLASREVSNAPVQHACGYGSIYLRLQPYLAWISSEATSYGAIPPQ